MAIETLTGHLGEFRKAHATAGGDASSTTPAVVQFPPGTRYVYVTTRNYTTAVVVQVGYCPYLRVFKTADNLATITDQSEVLQDASTSTTATFNSFDTAANNNYVYLGAHVPFRGAAVVVVNTNANASVLSVDYWNGAWTATSGLTDGTINTGATFGQNGNVTWTLPTDWVKVALTTAVATTAATLRDANVPLYWARFKASLAWDATVSASSIVAIPRTANGWELLTGGVREQMVNRGPDQWSGIEHHTDAGTANVIVNVAALSSMGFAS